MGWAQSVRRQAGRGVGWAEQGRGPRGRVNGRKDAPSRRVHTRAGEGAPAVAACRQQGCTDQEEGHRRAHGGAGPAEFCQIRAVGRRNGAGGEL
uniref:Uncharacterized protein n=1 Tax=Triticum urartu TaxID=4572 RepID=A0A8R7PSA1_TRIUA